MFCKRIVLKNFLKFTGKHLRWCPFLEKLKKKEELKAILQNTSERQLSDMIMQKKAGQTKIYSKSI